MHIDEFLTYHGVVTTLPSSSGMYATYGIYNLEAIIRKQAFGFVRRLYKSCNTIVQTLENAWIIRIELWHTWFEVLYTNK